MSLSRNVAAFSLSWKRKYLKTVKQIQVNSMTMGYIADWIRISRFSSWKNHCSVYSFSFSMILNVFVEVYSTRIENNFIELLPVFVFSDFPPRPIDLQWMAVDLVDVKLQFHRHKMHRWVEFSGKDSETFSIQHLAENKIDHLNQFLNLWGVEQLQLRPFK